MYLKFFIILVFNIQSACNAIINMIINYRRKLYYSVHEHCACATIKFRYEYCATQLYILLFLFK